MSEDADNSGSEKFDEFTSSILRHESLVAKILQIRTEKRPGKPGWQVFLESSGGVAIVTLLFGGLLTSGVAHLLDKNSRKADLQNQIIKLYADHSLNSRKETEQGRLETLRKSLGLLGDVLNAAQSRIDIDGPPWAQRRDPEQEKRNEAQKVGIRKRFNDVDEVWERERGPLGPLIAFYFDSKSQEKWRLAANAVDAYLECASTHRPNPEGEDLCKDKERSATDLTIQDLAVAMSNAPATAWLKLEEIDKIRAKLDEAQ